MKISFSHLKGSGSGKGFLALLLTLAFLAFMQVDTSAQAQLTSTTGGAQLPAEREIKTIPNGPFVQPNQAIELLIEAIKPVRQVMAQSAQGSAPYNAAFRTYTYYMGVMTELENGKAVPESIAHAIGTIISNLQIPTTANQAMAERHAVEQLLSL